MARGRRRGGRSARRLVASILRQLPDFFRLLAGLFRDPRVSRADKALALGVLAYVLAPIDLIPDVLGIFGLTDDVFLIGLALNRLVTRAGADVVLDHWRGSVDALEQLLDGLGEVGSALPRRVRRILQRRVDRGEARLVP